MRKILPILLAATVYLTPLYAVYAENSATTPAYLKSPRPKIIKETVLKNHGGGLITTGKDKMASRSGVWKEKLAKFKDKIKASRVETISTNLNDINKRRISLLSDALERMSKILVTIKSRVDQAESSGKDVFAIKSAIDDAQKAWTEADTALKAQLETDYSIAVNSETTVKDDAQTTRNSLHADLQSTHQKVKAARKALINVIQVAISSFQGGNSGK